MFIDIVKLVKDIKKKLSAEKIAMLIVLGIFKNTFHKLSKFVQNVYTPHEILRN